jgi:DNA invertase Pin-like site-specific DNA recombinase
MTLRGWVYGRSSGDEKDTGQDVRAQVEQVAAGLRARGYEVAGSCFDDGVSGDVHPDDRRGFQAAFLAIAQGKAEFLAIRDASRFSRCYPTTALDAFNAYRARGLRVLCLKESDFTTLAEDFDQDPEPVVVLTRFITLWKAWADLEGIRTSTAQVMAEILSGRRSTKSGLPPGRPEVQIDPEHVKAAQEAIAAGASLAAAHRLVLKLRKHDEAQDPRTKKKRYVGKETLARALGLRASRAKNPAAPTTPAGLVDGGSTPDAPVDGGAA